MPAAARYRQQLPRSFAQEGSLDSSSTAGQCLDSLVYHSTGPFPREVADLVDSVPSLHFSSSSIRAEVNTSSVEDSCFG